MAQWVKETALSVRQLLLLLWRGFDPWPRKIHMVQVLLKKKKKKEKEYKP